MQTYRENPLEATFLTTISSVGCLAILFLIPACSTDADVKTAQTETPYHYPFISPGTKFAALPPEVKKTVRAQAGAAAIADIAVFDKGSEPVFKVWFANPEVDPPIYIGSDGSVLGADFEVAVGAPGEDFETTVGSASQSSLSLDELTPEAVRAVHERAPQGVIRKITSQQWGERSLFIVQFEDDRLHPTLYVTADGTVLKEDPR